MIHQGVGNSVLSFCLQSSRKVLLVVPIVAFQHIACNQSTPHNMIHGSDSIPQNQPGGLDTCTTHLIPLTETSLSAVRTTPVVENTSQQKTNALFSHDLGHVEAAVETETHNKNDTDSIDSPTSTIAPLSSLHLVQKAARRLQEGNDLTYQKKRSDSLCVTCFEINQEQKKWEGVTQKVKSHTSMASYLAERGQQGHCSSIVNVVNFDNATNSSKKAGKKYVIKYPKPLKDMAEGKEGACDILSIAGEIFAYSLSEYMELGLVPETRIAVIIRNEQGGACPIGFGTIKPYVEDLKCRESLSDDAILQKQQGLLPDDITQREYSELVGHDTDDEGIQTLKLFSFIAGQWDLRQGNVLVRNDGSPVAIDNEHIFAPYHTVVKAESYEELRYKKTFIREDFKTRVQQLGSQDKPMVLHGSTRKVEAAMKQLLRDDTPKDETSQLSLEQEIALEHKTAAYLKDLAREGMILDRETWQKRIESKVLFAEDTQTIIFYIDKYQVYRHYPTEMSLYMSKCSWGVLNKFAHPSFLESAQRARQDTVNQISLLCDWMEHNGVEFYRGWQSRFDEQSGRYIPPQAVHYPIRFIYEVDNLGKCLEDAAVRRRDSTLHYFVKNGTTEELINNLHEFIRINEKGVLDDYLVPLDLSTNAGDTRLSGYTRKPQVL